MHLGIVRANDPWYFGNSEYLADFLQEKYKVSIFSSAKDLSGPLPDLFFSRFGGEYINRFANLSDYLEIAGAVPINSSAVVRLMDNKHLTQLIWKNLRLPQPPWIVVGREQQINNGAWRGKTILKPNSGSAGENISIHKNLQDGLQAAKEKSGLWILQPYIKPKAVWRVIIGKQNGIISTYKKSGKEEILSVTQGAKRRYKKIKPEGAKLAKSSLLALQGDMGGIDLLETKDGFLLLEANNNFGFQEDSREIMQRIEDEALAKLATKN